MSQTQTYIGVIRIHTCINCGIPFGMTQEFDNELQENHNPFFCPNGHKQWYSGETEKEKLQKEVTRLNQRIDYVRVQRDELSNQVQQLNYSVRAQKAAKTKILNRVKNGVCPCCNRTFIDLQRHFKSSHPELLK